MIENVYGIKTINIKTRVRCYCPLGNDWYTCDCDIELHPNNFLPDYCEVDSWIETNIDGKSFIVEEIVSLLYKYFNDNYQPKDCAIYCTVNDAKHSSVIVSK